MNKAINPRQLKRICTTTAFQSPLRPEAGSFPHIYNFRTTRKPIEVTGIIGTFLPVRPQSTRFGWYHHIRCHGYAEYSTSCLG